jgi:hypothetical protein
VEFFTQCYSLYQQITGELGYKIIKSMLCSEHKCMLSSEHALISIKRMLIMRYIRFWPKIDLKVASEGVRNSKPKFFMLGLFPKESRSEQAHDVSMCGSCRKFTPPLHCCVHRGTFIHCHTCTLRTVTLPPLHTQPTSFR